MNLNDADLAKSLECPVCLDLFDEPKLLNCGHTVCQKCVNKIRAAANAGPGRDGNCIKCPVCGGETEIPPEGLKTNYSLVDLVCRAQKPPVEACACNGCGKQEPVADMFTCQATLDCKPLWFCSLCAMKQHREHTTSECNMATLKQFHEAYEGITTSCRLADGFIGLTMSRLNEALKETERISQLLNQQKRSLSQLKARVEGASNDLTQEDLAASLQAANDLEQEIEQVCMAVTCRTTPQLSPTKQARISKALRANVVKSLRICFTSNTIGAL
ncbi:putative proteinconserved [Aphelenchoides avenae]|nr:putative proteinconserved [Aphelenchus avenae]